MKYQAQKRMMNDKEQGTEVELVDKYRRDSQVKEKLANNLPLRPDRLTSVEIHNHP